MNYLKQQRYLRESRVYALGSGIIFILLALACWRLGASTSGASMVVAAMVTGALVVCLWYLPNYLHLTVDPQRQARWAVKVRWRIVAAVLILGMVASSSRASAIAAGIASVWLLLSTLVAKRILSSAVAWLWVCEFSLIAVLVVGRWLNPGFGGLLLAAASHLAIVASKSRPFRWAGLTAFAGLAVLWISLYHENSGPALYALLTGLILFPGMVTAWLVHRSQRQNEENKAAAMRELTDFTGYGREKIEQLWAVSNRQLAENWQQAAIPPDESERLAQWYRDNSELYLFAISGYNLEYKRIVSNLNVMKSATGSCLDYGAGNGEIILELARRGHRATYYDVDGVTMKFARSRAARQNLAVSFCLTKDELAADAQGRGFDTIFSFDVLEHLPDLPGELNFLSSLLASGGLLMFDVPAGSTKAHPMHLNHNLNVFSFMNAKQLRDERGLALRLPFKKEEKYAYRKL